MGHHELAMLQPCVPFYQTVNEKWDRA